jgi:hypothetical protein
LIKMRGWLVAIVLLVAGSASAQDPGVVFAPTLPEAVVDVAGWEVVSGEFESTFARGAYRFYVNPRLQGIYQLMRYRVQLLSPETTLERRRRSGERVAFVRRPGAREPLLCWERTSSGEVATWREVPAGTDEYRMEMATLIRVLAVHRTADAARTP